MCGIAGFVDFGGRPVQPLAAALDRMQNALGHRGPDDADRVVMQGARASVGLAHQRLAIIDLSPRGRQPMMASNGSWLTYNGEIYNFRALRRALIAGGFQPRSESDTEVVGEMLVSKGTAALEQFRGMFAFGFWDDAKCQLLLARDRFGIKPLVYARPAPDLLLFASEPRALMASGYVSSERAEDQVPEFLARGSVSASGTFWQNVSTVAPGEYVTVDATAGLRSRSYWSLEDTLLRPTPIRSAREVARRIRPALLESVEAHLVSDVPVAVFLSGGLDSTALLAAAREVASGPLQTFTIAMPGCPADESQYARAVARHFGSDHIELTVDAVDVSHAFDDYFRAVQTPSIDGFNTFLVAQAARRAGMRVALSGVGGDELYGGYATFIDVERTDRARQRFGRAIRVLHPLMARWMPCAASRLDRLIPSDPLVDVWSRCRRVLDDADIAHLSGVRTPRLPAPSVAASAFDAVRYFEFRDFLMRQLLPDADAFTMCHALELRTPYVDHRLVESTVSAGRWRRARGLSYKATLFRHLEGLYRPDAIARRKQGFVLPYDHWIRTSLLNPAAGCLPDLRARLDRERYRPFVGRYLDGQLHWSSIWALYVLERVSERPFAGRPLHAVATA
jgi:asparagine synthase (glutamine-hydrolysing)